MKKIFDYFRESYAELRRVSWPTRLQTIHYTILVVIISLLVAAFLGILDYFFGLGLQRYMSGPQADPISEIQQGQTVEVGEDGAITGEIDTEGALQIDDAQEVELDTAADDAQDVQGEGGDITQVDDAGSLDTVPELSPETDDAVTSPQQ
jgi:preprotein translocase subunit SecE